MRARLEQINQENHSFQLMYNPRLSDLFFWHFHPEYELTYIAGADGHRRVGSHISPFYGSDLVLIGSNIPHLNFDYRVKTDYKKVVVHFNQEFVEKRVRHTPELSEISDLFKKSGRGLTFRGAIKDKIGEELLRFESINSFEQYLRLMSLMQQLAHLGDEEALHDQPYINPYPNSQQERLRRIYAFTDEHYQRKVGITEVAELCNMTGEAFCRYFKKVTGQSYLAFLNRYRISQAKLLLSSGTGISEAGFRSGFESLSYFSRVFKKLTDETPKKFRDRQLNL